MSLAIRSGTVVTPEGVSRADVFISGESFSGPGHAAQEIDATGMHVFPAVLDVHVHFNEPGRADWEGAETGSRALAAGGGALFIDMPLNSTPCTVNAREFERKRAALEAASIADFGLWGGLVPGNAGELAEMAACGAMGFKAFLCDSGLPEFPRADDLTLFEGMRECAKLGLPVLVHAESEEICRALAARCRSEGRAGIRDFLESRPVVAEVEAIARACLLARETGAKLHIVHISSGRGVVAAVEAKRQGADVSIETCPHYLAFTGDDLERLGVVAKCAPPLRSAADRHALWQQVLNGAVEIVASDHSPAPPAMKSGSFWEAWGGIAGVQSTLGVLLNESALPLERIASLTAREPARRFRIPRKGSIAEGNDADLVLVDLSQTTIFQPEFQRHPISPYAGMKFRGGIRQTIRRGETIYADGRIVARTRGKFVRPI
jgi:allantoinase